MPRIAAATASGDLGRVLAQRERRFAAALLAPAFLALLATTTLPLMFLVGTSAFRMDLAMPFADGFVGFDNYRTLLADDRFWSSLLVSLIYTGSTVGSEIVNDFASALGKFVKVYPKDYRKVIEQSRAVQRQWELVNA